MGQLLLQIEGATHHTTSHYQGLEPITMINGIELEQKTTEQIKRMMRNNAKYENKYAKFTNVRNKKWEIDHIPTNRVNVEGTKESTFDQIISEYQKKKGEERETKNIYWEEIMGGIGKRKREEWSNIKESKPEEREQREKEKTDQRESQEQSKISEGKKEETRKDRKGEIYTSQ